MWRSSSPSATANQKKSTRAGGANRVGRVEKEMQTQIAQYLSAAYKAELPGLVTITRVRMPADLRAAYVSVSFLLASSEDPQAEAEAIERGLEILQSWAPDIQSYLNDRVGLRYCPRITFELDTITEKVMRVDSLLKNLSPR